MMCIQATVTSCLSGYYCSLTGRPVTVKFRCRHGVVASELLIQIQVETNVLRRLVMTLNFGSVGYGRSSTVSSRFCKTSGSAVASRSHGGGTAQAEYFKLSSSSHVCGPAPPARFMCQRCPPLPSLGIIWATCRCSATVLRLSLSRYDRGTGLGGLHRVCFLFSLSSLMRPSRFYIQTLKFESTRMPATP